MYATPNQSTRAYFRLLVTYIQHLRLKGRVDSTILAAVGKCFLGRRW